MKGRVAPTKGTPSTEKIVSVTTGAAVKLLDANLNRLSARISTDDGTNSLRLGYTNGVAASGAGRGAYCDRSLPFVDNVTTGEIWAIAVGGTVNVHVIEVGT